MTWTWDPEMLDDPGIGISMQVRSMVGDTDPSDMLQTDEEIALVVSQYPPNDGRPPWLASAAVCDQIAGLFGRRMQQSIGPLSRAAQQQWEHYRDMAEKYRALYASDGKSTTTNAGASVLAVPSLGGGGKTYLGTTPDFDKTMP